MGLEPTVFPTRVGVNRAVIRWPAPVVRIPHTRGGEPEVIERIASLSEYSPHAWG